MPIWGTGPKRTDGQTNFQINATPYTQLPANYPRNRTGGPIMGYRFLPYTQVVSNYGLWFDAMDTSTIRDIGGNFPPRLPPNQLGIGRWNDKSVNNRHLSNISTDPAQFNLMSPGTFYPVVFAAGGASRLRLQTTPASFTGISISAFFVLSLPTTSYVPPFNYTSSFNAMPIPINPNGPNPSTFDFSLRYLSNTIGFSRHGGNNNTNTAINVISAPFPTNTTTLVSIFVNGSQTTIGNVLPSTNLISINGSFVSSSTTYAGNPFNFQYISMFSGYNFSFQVPSFFNEVGFFYRTLTTPERVAYESQLIRKWGLPSNSPVTLLNQNPVTNGLYLNIDAYNQSLISTTLTSDGLRRVDTAFDKSGNNRNFKFTTGFSNIFYNRVSTMNQYNSLYFSTGSYSGILSNINPIYTFSTNSYSLFLVYNQLSTNSASRVFAANNQSGSDVGIGAFSYQLLGQTSFITPRDYQFAGNIVNGRNYVYSLINNGGPTYDIYQTSTFYSYHNFGTGAALTCNINLASTNLLNVSRFNIGGATFGQNFCFNGLISEVILYNRGLSNFERLQVENYLINKWGISTLISNVPITRGLNLWLDCYDQQTMIFSTNTNLVTQWRDKSISTLHFSNALTSATIRPPSYTINPANSLPGLLFSNNNPTNTFATALYNCNFNYPVTTEATIFTVSQWSSGNNSFYSPVFCMLSNNEFVNINANNFIVVGPAGGNSVGLYRSSPGLLGSIANTLNRPTLVTGVFNSTFTTIPDIPQNNMAVGRNGVIGAISISSFISTLGNGALKAANFNVNQAVLGLRGPAGGDGTWFHAGYIHEVLLYNRTLNFVERQQVESYLLSKWNI
jgi:hypothetical protein